MIKVDGFYIYNLGYSIHPLSDLKADAPFEDWVIAFLIAHTSVETFLQRSVFRPKASQTAGNKLLGALRPLIEDTARNTPVTVWEAYSVTNALSEFEHVLTAEFGLLNLYLVEKIRGYETSDLIERGHVLFPESLLARVPAAVPDIEAATRAIAFELPTAAAFHLYRATESVVRRYFEVVALGVSLPVTRNLGGYLAVLKNQNLGEPKVLSALRDLKDLHRNPQVHPEESLNDVDEALALLGSVHAAIVMMLKALPDLASGDNEAAAGEAPVV